MTRAPRLPLIERADMTAEQARAHDDIVAGPRGSIAGPLSIWIRVPAFADHAQKLGAYCRFGTALRGDLRELAILITGKHLRSGFEWWAHETIALAEGLDPAIIAAVKDELPLSGNEEVHAVHDFCSELLRTNRISPKSYSAALALFGSDQLVELVAVVGYYSLICHTINAFEVPVPPGAEDPFPDPR
jgi:4-carboxymuconolactone decarboxylase